MRKLAIFLAVLSMSAVAVLYASSFDARVSMSVQGEVVANPVEAKLGYKVYAVELTAGQASQQTTPLRLYNRFPVNAEVISLVTSHPEITVDSFSPATVSSSDDSLIDVSYNCASDAPGGTYPVTHHLSADIDSAHVELTFDIDIEVTVLHPPTK